MNSRRRSIASVASLVVAAALAACSDFPTAPAADLRQPTTLAPAFSSIGRCAASLDFVATDEASLRGAIGSAQAGDVIGIDGTIQLAENLWIDKDGITLTCASAGSGLSARDNSVWALIGMLAADLTVSGLALDGHATGSYPIYAVNNGLNLTATNLTFTGNEVRCGFACMFIVGADRSLIAGNRFEASYANTGIHLQGFHRFDGLRFPIDGTRIEGNTVVALRPTGHVLFGAIRPRDGRGIIVADNVVEGPWSNGVGVAEIQDSRVERNRVRGTARFALFISSNPFSQVSTSNSLFRANHLNGGSAAIYARRACGNVINGNVLSSAEAWAVVFEPTTGSNAFLGRGTAVSDEGAMDCDGDGDTDPNVITGAGRIGAGGSIGTIVSEVLRTVGGHEIQ